LWTVQSVDAWEDLQAKGFFRTKPELALAEDKMFLPITTGKVRRNWGYEGAYAWIAEQMEKRGVRRLNECVLPVWAWYQWRDDRHKRPDIRAYRHYYFPNGKAVRIEFEADNDSVLLSDGELWTWFVLNYWFLPTNLEEDESFKKELSARNLDYFLTKPLPNAEYDAKIKSSWEKIFNLDFKYRPINAFARRNKQIQATLWELKVEQVTNSVIFSCRVYKEAQ
jgi:hypothetical protein